MIIEFKGISKAYGGVRALVDADLTVQSGEIRALLGGNGSGKSTLIKVASGLIAADSGRIRIDGQEVDVHSPQSAKRLGIVATSQELSILSNLTVGENIALCAIPKTKLGFIDYRAIERRSREILAMLGLEGRADERVSSLSLNEQYLVELGKALFQEFDILMIDEVTSALYEKDVAVVRSILNALKAQGKIIVFVSHRMKEIRDICDTVTVMRNGHIIKTSDVDAVDDDYLLSLMIGEKSAPSERASEAQDETGTNEAPAFIQVRGLPIPQYGTRIDLDIARGEIVGIAGLQGHGQSDIVRALHGLSGPVRLRIDGEDVELRSPIDAVRRKIAFVSGDREAEGSFKQHDLAENVSAVQELILGQKLPSRRAVLDALNVVYASESQGILSLSGGNQQKVIFARWICTDPVLLLADDPSKGIDVHARSEMQAILKRLSAQGTSMIIVSSDDDELEKICRITPNARVLVMYEGNVVATLRGVHITRDNIIEATHSGGRAAKA